MIRHPYAEKENKYGAIFTWFNGAIWLARNKFYSMQYLGSGKTEQESISDMEKTITERHLKARLDPYFDKNN